jgi:hypothetical protein
VNTGKPLPANDDVPDPLRDLGNAAAGWLNKKLGGKS